MNLLNLFRRRPESQSAVPALADDVGRLARDLTGIVAQYQTQLHDGGHSERRIYDGGRPGKPERRQT